MKMVPCKVEEAKGSRSGYTNLYALIMEFMDSGHEGVRIENFTQKNAYVCTSSLRSAIKRYRIHGVTAVSRKGNVYLLKE